MSWPHPLLEKKNPKSPAWRYFGYRRDKYGLPENKNLPICRLCKIIVKVKDGSTGNLLKHLQNHHSTEFASIIKYKVKSTSTITTSSLEDKLSVEEESAVIIMKKKAKSAVWQYFGYRLDKGGTLQDRDKPTCVICHKVVVTKGGNTSNLLRHLSNMHPEEYKLCQEVQQETAKELAMNVNSTDLDFLPKSLLPKRNGTSSVWKYFGFRPNPCPGKEGEPLDKSKPTCTLCFKDVKADNSTTNLFHHMKVHHTRESQIMMEPDKSCSYTCKADSDSSSSLDSHTDSNCNTRHSRLLIVEHYTCYRCEKTLVDKEVINNKRAGAKTPKGKIDRNYCWDCFAVLHNIGFTEKYYDVVVDTAVDVAVDTGVDLAVDTVIDVAVSKDTFTVTTETEADNDKMVTFFVMEDSPEEMNEN